MAFGTAVQHTSANGATATQPTATFASTPTQGNLLVCGVYMNVANTTLTMSSSGWRPLTAIATTSLRSGRMFYKYAGASESTTVTINESTGAWVIAIGEYDVSGVTMDATVTENATSGTGGAGPYNTPSVTPTSGRQALIVAWVGEGANSASGNSCAFTGANRGTTNNEEQPHRSAASGCLFDTVVSSTTGAYQGNVTFINNGVNTDHIVIFTKAASDFKAFFFSPWIG